MASQGGHAIRQDSYYDHCHVFVDHSNLWIEGQKYHARKLKLSDVGQDPRFRVDLGRFLDLVVGGRDVTEAFLYGSRPPPNDSVWKAAKERNFVVQVFDRAGGMPYGREKEVDMAMGVDITEQACDCDYADRANTVFIIVTGDRDFTRPVTKVLKKGIRVELWAWKTGMSIEFRRLANQEDLLTVHEIENIAERFSFTAYKSSRISGDIDPAHTIIFQDLPKGKKFLQSFADDLLRLLRLFYITQLPPTKRNEELELQDIAVVFPKSKPDVVLKQLERLSFPYKACSYAVYNSQAKMAKHQPPQILLTNRYEALSSLDTSDYESTAEAITGSLNLDIDDVIIGCEGSSLLQATATDPETYSSVDESDTDSTGWVEYINRKAGAWSHRRKLKQTPCRWGIHCAKAANCKYLHTEQEQDLFKKFPWIKFQYWKASRCTKETRHSAEQCSRSHSRSETWCLKCKSLGHPTDDCAG